MFSSTAYEAVYTYIGIYLHEASIQVITSQHVLIGFLVLIFAAIFLFTCWGFFSRYIPSVITGKSKGYGLATFVKILACFLLSVAILKISAPIQVKDFKKVSWKTNAYIETKFPDIEESYNVSFIFDILVTSAEELARFGSLIVDKLFSTTHSELEAPAIFYRSLMYAGSLTIEDPELRAKIDVYTHECFDKVIHLISSGRNRDKVDEFFQAGGVVDSEMARIPIETEDGHKISCLTLKNEVKRHFELYAMKKGEGVSHHLNKFRDTLGIDSAWLRNYLSSSALSNYLISQKENRLGIHEGAEVPGTTSNIIQIWSRLRSFDGFISLIGLKEQVGAGLTAERAQKFSEYLQRAPHIKGMVKMILIFIFPWLVFFVIAGRWKVLVYWYLLYVSVLLWTPIWTLFYHIMTGIALSTDTLAAFGEVSITFSE